MKNIIRLIYYTIVYMSKNKLPVILFDVNEILIDMVPFKKKINSLLNSNKGFRIKFGTLLL